MPVETAFSVEDDRGHPVRGDNQFVPDKTMRLCYGLRNTRKCKGAHQMRSSVAMSINDVPSPIDFHDPEDAKAWIEETARKRPWRPEFFNVYVETLNKKFHHPFSILELGAGPGLLAEQILRRCALRSFVLLDFSAAMLSIASHRLQPFCERTRFVQRDFRSSSWVDG